MECKETSLYRAKNRDFGSTKPNHPIAIKNFLRYSGVQITKKVALPLELLTAIQEEKQPQNLYKSGRDLSKEPIM